ncbi:Fmu Sun domain containing protein [Nitzschia inconspicua]|uniref:Fmu Sun domain containing protein n=1 Tax=Nitzschia inconspicua TaxID=303405 RepID=A0A9K3PN53_9STRA|nr:Fmu Sun domain containing protein [Nitzschia inconspicua]
MPNDLKDSPETNDFKVNSSFPQKRPRDGRDNAALRIQSLNDLTVGLAPEIVERLRLQNATDKGYVERLMTAMKTPVAKTICRVNLIQSTRGEVLKELQKILSSSVPNLEIREHSLFPDVIEIEEAQLTMKTNSPHSSNLSSCTKPRSDDDASLPTSLFSSWPMRQEKGWPMTHRAILCDRFCGEAVLRGSDIFVRGILAADSGIKAGEKVAVYADIPRTCDGGAAPKKIARGLILDNYNGNCVFLGMGTMACSRSEVFSQSNGLAVSMSLHPTERVGPLLPPLSNVLIKKIMLQNLPSILVANALNPQPGDVILDMCSAPGGKTAHLASLVKNQALIVACDRSRKKMIEARNFFKSLGASCITPLALDSTRCVSIDRSNVKSVKEVIEQAKTNPDDGLKNVKSFSPESFDKILLDPPCSALGLRPKLVVAQQSLREVDKHASYQRKFVAQAVQLLKPGGIMTYSTCTMNNSENEMVVKHILIEYPSMDLISLGLTEEMEASFGRPGLGGFGLTEEQRLLVRRFDPGDAEQDTMGFFVARFRKKL